MVAIVAIGIPAVLFFVGLYVMTELESRHIRRDPKAIDPMFLKRRR